MLVALSAGHGELLPGVALWPAGMLLRTGAAAAVRSGDFWAFAALVGRAAHPVVARCWQRPCPPAPCPPCAAPPAAYGPPAVRRRLLKPGRAPRTTVLPTESKRPWVCTAVWAPGTGSSYQPQRLPPAVPAQPLTTTAISTGGSVGSYRVVSAELVSGANNLCSATRGTKAVHNAFVPRVGQPGNPWEGTLQSANSGATIRIRRGRKTKKPTTGPWHWQADCAGGNIETGKYAWLGRFVQTVEQRQWHC